jgi:hypothetical protein
MTMTSLSKRTRLVPLAVMGLSLFIACAEWDKYWDEDQLIGPTIPRDETPPTVSVVSPSGPDSSRATPVGGSQYMIVVNVIDDVGVARVDLYIDDLPPFEILSPPWELGWDTTALDETSHHRLWARAFDEAGNVGTSEPVFAQVFNDGPEVTLTDPDDGALVLGTISVAVAFPGEAPDIAQVEFLADVWTIDTITAPPWTVTFDTTTLPSGEHFLAAKATTVLGHVGVSPAVRIHVNNGAPTMTIDFPSSGHQVATLGTLVLIGSAFDDEEGEIPPGSVWWRSDRQGALGTGHELWAENLVPGMHDVTATATNAWGTETSQTIQVEVLSQPTYDYCDDIQWPLFEKYFCTFCHHPESSEYPNSELDLRSYASLMLGGKTTIYKCVYPCRPESSLVYNKITAIPPAVPWLGDHMPPPSTANFPFVRPEIAERLRVWILEGAPRDDPEDCW